MAQLSRIRELLEDQAADLDRLEDRHVRQTLQAYEDARRELRDRLAALEGTGRAAEIPATAQHVRVMLAQSEDGVRRLKERLGEVITGAEAQLQKRALGNLLRTIELAEPEFHETGPAVEVEAVRRLAEQAGLLLHRHSLDRYGSEVVTNIQRALAAGQVQGLTVRELTDLVAGSGSSVLSRYRHRAELIVRMELARVYDQAHQASLEEAAAFDDPLDPDPLLKRADEIRDTRNHPLSPLLHGQAVRPQSEFEVAVALLPKGSTAGIVWRRMGSVVVGHGYPAHFNDRGRQVPWRMSWEGKTWVDKPSALAEPLKPDDLAGLRRLSRGEQLTPMSAPGLMRLRAARAIERRGREWVILPDGMRAIGLPPHGPLPSAAPAPPPAPPPPAPAPPPPKPRHEVILHKQTGTAQGSNQGGFYTGADGVDRYVKFYTDPAQAAGEHLANRLYQDLGIAAPDSELFRMPSGELAYASKILPNNGTIGSAGPPSGSVVKKALEGFAADILTANWDAAGLTLDNMVVLPDGRVARIDNGGAFLARAQGARKPAAVLAADRPEEWWRFFDAASNPGYGRLVSGYFYSPIEIEDLEQQVTAIEKLRPAKGGWAAYVDKHGAEGLTAAERAQIADMMERRTRFLVGKREDARALERLDALESALPYSDRAGARSHGNATLQPARKALTKAELTAVKRYTGSAYVTMNGTLRGGGKPTPSIQALDGAIRKSPLPADTLVYRGTRSCAPVTSAVNQGVRSEGNTITDPGFGSCSILKGVSESFGGTGNGSVLFRILAKKGSPAMWVEDISTVPGEMEVLNPPGATLRVLHSEWSPLHRRWLVDAVLE